MKLKINKLLVSFSSTIVSVKFLRLLYEVNHFLQAKNNSWHSCYTCGCFFLFFGFCPGMLVCLSSCACLIPSSTEPRRGGPWPPWGWCNIADTWQQPHLSQTNPLVPKNTVYPHFPALLLEAHVLYMCRFDGTCCVCHNLYSFRGLKVPQRFWNVSVCVWRSVPTSSSNGVMWWDLSSADR